jgi:phosphatidylglycerol:prolipoprotein diacylglycerol transferase
MEPQFTVPTHLWDGAYAIFYQITFVAGALLIFYEGHRRKWPLLPWLIVIGFCAVGAIIGSKLAVLALEELNEAVQHWRLPYSTQKTYLGGILGGIAGVYLARRWQGFRYSVLDAFAITVPLALAIGRAGCLLSGCCFDTPTSLPWAVVYETSSTPYCIMLVEASPLLESARQFVLPGRKLQSNNRSYRWCRRWRCLSYAKIWRI